MTNVLDIVSTVSASTSLCSCRRPPSRPRSRDDAATGSSDNDNNEVRELFEQLALACLQTIDRNAETLLEGEDWLLLPPKMVQFVIKRDTLCLTSETPVIKALNRWCVHRCTKRSMMATLKNKVQHKSRRQHSEFDLIFPQTKMLRDLKLQVRWLTLTPSQLEMAQAQYGLLSSREFKTILQVRVTFAGHDDNLRPASPCRPWSTPTAAVLCPPGCRGAGRRCRSEDAASSM